MAGQDLCRVKCSERFIRRIKRCERWVVLAALLALSYPPGPKAFCLQWYGSKKCDGETAPLVERGKFMEMEVSGGESGRHERLHAERLSEKLT